MDHYSPEVLQPDPHERGTVRATARVVVVFLEKNRMKNSENLQGSRLKSDGP